MRVNIALSLHIILSVHTIASSVMLIFTLQRFTVTAFYLFQIACCHYKCDRQGLLFLTWSKYIAPHGLIFGINVTTNQDFVAEFENPLMHSQDNELGHK